MCPLLDLLIGEVKSAGLDPQVRVLGDPDATGGVEVRGSLGGLRRFYEVASAPSLG